MDRSKMSPEGGGGQKMFCCDVVDILKKTILLSLFFENFDNLILNIMQALMMVMNNLKLIPSFLSVILSYWAQIAYL